MKIFECPHCGQMLFFENTTCERCGHALGYLPESAELTALEMEGNVWFALSNDQQPLRYCANHAYGACNWLLQAEENDELCGACRLNRTIPSLDQHASWLAWQRIEVAKHRLIYSLLRLGLPIVPKMHDAQYGLCFDFLAPGPDGAPVMTGHESGVITINLQEADPAQREHFRANMNEPYRTLLGHFRHEVGHYYWERLIQVSESNLQAFRNLFGDETLDYGAALQRHYQQGPPEDWKREYVSAYATMHPWEDWAETWAHYLHVVDTLETAHAFGLRLRPRAGDDPSLAVRNPPDSYRETDFNALLDAWFPVTFAVNSINRSMGQPDLYPFVLSPRAIEKLAFVHQVVRVDI